MDMKPPSIQNSTSNTLRDSSSSIIQIVLLAIVLVLFSWFILKPKLSQSTEVRGNLKAAEAQLAKVRQDQQDLDALISELRSSPDEIVKIDEALPLNGRISKAYVQLDNLVQSSGMTLTIISTDDTAKTISAADKVLLENPYQPGRALHTITLTATVTGSMDQFKNLLELIETSGRVLDVETVEIDGGEPLTKFTIEVKAYAYENTGVKDITEWTQKK